MALQRIDDLPLLAGKPLQDVDIDLGQLGLDSDTDDEAAVSAVGSVFRPSRFTVSTMTIMAGVRCRLDLGLLYEHVRCHPDSEQVLSVRYGDSPVRGQPPAAGPARRAARSERKVFLNQVTADVCPSPGRRISVKIFGDGQMQLAGCLHEGEGLAVVQALVTHLRELEGRSQEGAMPVWLTDEQLDRAAAARGRLNEASWRELLYRLRARRVRPADRLRMQLRQLPYHRLATEGELACRPLEVVMINSDFDTGRPIDKDAFRLHLVQRHGLWVAPHTPRVSSWTHSCSSCQASPGDKAC